MPDAIPFHEIGSSIALYCRHLLERVTQQNASSVLFCSREGFLLKAYFDALAAARNIRIQTHYAKLSRRSTLLPALSPLDNETFITVFRQYRSISIHDFLRTIGLQDYFDEILRSARISSSDASAPSQDLPTDSLFTSVVTSDAFCHLYERERLSQNTALFAYIKSLVGTSLNDLFLADVGWKGTIQDNLFSALRTHVSNLDIYGAYLGLSAAGGAGPNNRKSGELFTIDGRLPFDRFFRECPSLFEIFLPAAEGSALRYRQDETGSVEAVTDDFPEKALIVEQTLPVATAIFEATISNGTALEMTVPQLCKYAGLGHKRLVFNPTRAELAWLERVWHAENFGVFSRSRLYSRRTVSLRQRVKNTVKLFQRPHDLGFWPYLSLKEGALPGVATLYSLRQQIRSYR